MNTRKIIGSFILFGLLSNIHVRGQGCVSPLGMEDGRIRDSQITASSVIKERTPHPWLARLHRNIPSWGAWCPDYTGGKIAERNYDQYIQIDLVNLTKITGIATQGRSRSGGREYAKDYKISYRRDGGIWNFYAGKNQTVKIFRGNTDVSSVVRHDLDPAIIARYIRVHPGYHTGNTVCMRLELYGCAPNKQGIFSYSMPVGHTTSDDKVSFKDTSYNGVITNGVYKDGTGILTDGKFGPVDAKQDGGNGWVGWFSNSTTSPYIDITFEFSGVRKFKDVTLTVNVDKARSYAVFKRSGILFASTEENLMKDSFLQYSSRNCSDNDHPYSTNVTLSLGENTARFIKLRLYFGGRWLLISEISFNSVPVSTHNEETRLLKCPGNSYYSCSKKLPFPTQIYYTPTNATVSIKTDVRKTCDCEEAINSTAMFFVGVAATLAVVLVVFGLIWFIKRRQASKMYTDVVEVDTVELKNEIAGRPPANNRGQDRSVPIDDETTPYEEVQNLSSSAYAELNRNQNANADNTYQKLLKRDSDYVVPNDGDEEHSYEEVGKKKPPPGYTGLDQTKRVKDDDEGYQKLLKK